MILQAIFAFAILVYVDSGSPLPNFLHHWIHRRLRKNQVTAEGTSDDVIEETLRVEKDDGDALRVMSLVKRFRGNDNIAVDRVSFGVAEGDTFALIGPNGAGKTTTLACVRGSVCLSTRIWRVVLNDRKSRLRETCS